MELRDIQTVSTFSALLPIVIGSFALYRQRYLIGFYVFLSVGFLTDMLGYAYMVHYKVHWLYEIAVIMQNVYTLIDAVYLFVFLGQIAQQPLRKWFRITAIIMLPLWVTSYFILKNAWFVEKPLSSLFDTLYMILLSLSSALLLMHMTRYEARAKLHDIIFVTGIFFYNFCSFFIHAFIDDKIIGSIWFLTSTFNLITMIVYSFGFYFSLRYKAEGIKQ